MRKDIFQHLEREISEFHASLKRVKELREDILSTPMIYEERVKNSFIQDPTGRKATLLASNQILLRTQKMVDIIWEEYSKLDQNKKELIKLIYWSKPSLSIEECAQQIPISVRQASRWRRHFVYNVANKLGYW